MWYIYGQLNSRVHYCYKDQYICLLHTDFLFPVSFTLSYFVYRYGALFLSHLAEEINDSPNFSGTLLCFSFMNHSFGRFQGRFLNYYAYENYISSLENLQICDRISYKLFLLCGEDVEKFRISIFLQMVFQRTDLEFKMFLFELQFCSWLGIR